jgi:hypothetical protein
MNTLLEEQVHTTVQPSLALADSERQRCEVWTRVMGYHRPVSSFNTGKKGEFAERLYFEERRCDLNAPATPR